jgi:hypothetical protein
MNNFEDRYQSLTQQYEMPICRNCGHPYLSHLCPVEHKLSYCDVGDSLEVCGCEAYSPLTHADVLEDEADTDRGAE